MIGKRKYDIVALSVITIVIFLFFFRLFFPTPQMIITPDFGQSDALSAFSTKYFYGSQLAARHIPLWTSQIGGGYPIFALGTMATFFLPNLFFFSFLPPIWAYNVTLVFSLCLMGWGMYAWLRMMGYQRIACVFGAITTALSGYTIVQLTHITIVQSYCLFPILAAATLRLANKKSWMTVAWIIIILSQQIFIGFPQCVFITLLFLGAYWLWLMRSIEDRWQKTFLFGLAIVAGCIAAAVQILPSIEYLKTLVTENGFSPDQATIFSYPFKHLLTLLNPYALGNPAIGTYPHFLDFEGSIFWENTAYIGIVPLLAIAGYVLFPKIRKASKTSLSFVCILLVLSFLLMTGSHSPLYFVFSFWPFNLFRVPSRFVWLFEIALIIAGVHAFHAIVEYFKKTRPIVLLSVLIVCIHVLSLFIVWSPYHALVPANEWLKDPSLSQFVDRSYNTISVGAERLYNSVYAPKGWANLVGEKDPSYLLRNTFTPDKNMLWNIPQIGDYTGRSIRRSQVYTDLFNQSMNSDASNATISATGIKFLTLLSVKNIISTLPLTQQGLLLKAQLSDATHSIDLYENPNALPRVYFAKRAVFANTLEEAVKIIISDDFVPGESIIVENPKLSSEYATQGNIQIAQSKEGNIVTNVSNAADGAILVCTQTFYPGWRAKIDGHDANVFPVNIKHIGVQVPIGNHRIEFLYQPDSFTYGALVSAVALGITVVLMAFGFFRSLWHTHRKTPAHASHRRRSRGR